MATSTPLVVASRFIPPTFSVLVPIMLLLVIPPVGLERRLTASSAVTRPLYVVRTCRGHSNIILTHLIFLDPNAGEDAKQRARAKLEEHGVEVDEQTQ
jgi:hypothetical protein